MSKQLAGRVAKGPCAGFCEIRFHGGHLEECGNFALRVGTIHP